MSKFLNLRFELELYSEGTELHNNLSLFRMSTLVDKEVLPCNHYDHRFLDADIETQVVSFFS